MDEIPALLLTLCVILAVYGRLEGVAMVAFVGCMYSAIGLVIEDEKG